MSNNYENLTDEEFLSIEDPSMSEPIEEAAGDETDSTTEDGSDTTDVENVEPDDTEDDSDADDDGDTHIDDTDDEADGESDDDSDEDDDQASNDTNTQDAEDDTEDATDFDFESGYKEIMAPIRANDKDVTIDSVEDMRRLASKGLGFSEKMRVLRPHLKIIKSLSDNDLLDQEKLNHLIDLSKGDESAITKLMADKDVDPLDIKTQEAGDYKPNNYEVSDSSFNLDQAIEDIKGTESFERSMTVMGEQWDSDSRTKIQENPEIVGIINDHIQSGVFDAVKGFVDKEQALGRLTGLPDVEAYYRGAQMLQESGALVNGNQGEQKADSSSDPKKEDPLKREAKKQNKAKAKTRANKKAASLSRSSKSGKKSKDTYEHLSDEDFLKEFEGL